MVSVSEVLLLLTVMLLSSVNAGTNAQNLNTEGDVSLPESTPMAACIIELYSSSQRTNFILIIVVSVMLFIFKPHDVSSVF